MVEMTKDQVGTMNAMAILDWETAKTMLVGVNLMCGGRYEWLNKRVVVRTEDGKIHDAYTIASEA